MAQAERIAKFEETTRVAGGEDSPTRWDRPPLQPRMSLYRYECLIASSKALASPA